MDHTQSQFHGWAMVLGCLVALGSFACADSPSKGAGGSGGGAGGSGGGAGGLGGGAGGSGGGAGGLGGSSTTSPGNLDAAIGSGGTPGSVDGGPAAGGTGGSIPTITCATDADCATSGLVCEPTTKRCAQCTKTADCPTGQHCLGNSCVASPTACTTSLQCAAEDKVCDPARGLCVQCATSADCITPPGQQCVANVCVTLSTCQTSLDCGAQVCDPTSKTCVDCVADNDCNAPGATSVQHCIKNFCKPECTSDKQCTPQGMLCDAATKVCAQCKADTDCPASSFCEGGVCKPDVCDSTEAMCSGAGVAQCNPAGSGWTAVTTCPADKPCKAVGGAAACGGPTPPIDGGVLPIDGGIISPIDGGNCTTATQNPCTAIAKFTGTQVVDGSDDEFCQVPLFVFMKSGAAVVNNYNNIQDSEFPVVAMRVAWDAAGLHAFFDVADTSVQSVAMKDPAAALQKPYQGDSIELYFSSSDTVTGAPGGDANAVHVTLAASGPSVSVLTVNNNGLTTTYTELPAAEYKAVKTTAGYAIEALIPWAGAAPAANAKVRFDLAVNVADTNFNTVDDMRDAQMILNVTPVTGQTPCPSGADPWCDDRAWCSTTLQP